MTFLVETSDGYYRTITICGDCESSSYIKPLLDKYMSEGALPNYSSDSFNPNEIEGGKNGLKC